jgi:hypothetical protein
MLMKLLLLLLQGGDALLLFRWRCAAVTASGDAEIIAATAVGKGAAL